MAIKESTTLFMTGFPGFISGRLLPELVRDRAFGRVLLLTEEAQMDRARATLETLALPCPAELIEGDISRPGLGVQNQKAQRLLLSGPAEWWHLAALYRLDADPLEARRINVDGTRHVLEAGLAANPPPRFHYVSTAYVSGLATGHFGEDDLPEPVAANFKNHYEHTKNEAEWEMRGRMDRLPTTVYRPAIVTGDSKTGETQKFDGPFLTIQYLSRMGRLPVPRIGPMQSPLNIIPVDYLVAAMTRISGLEDSENRCFQIVDPSPGTSGQFFDLVARSLGRPISRWESKASTVEGWMRFRPVRRLIGMPREAIRYINHTVHYDCSNTASALRGSGLRCPSIGEYIDNLVRFYQQNQHRRELYVPIP